MPNRTRQNWIETVEDREKELNQFGIDSQIKLNETFFEQLKAGRRTSVQNLDKATSPEKAQEIAEKSYDALRDFYNMTFLGIGTDKYWGKERIKSLFTEDSEVHKEEFMQTVAQGDRLDLGSVGKFSGKMSENLTKKLTPGIFGDLTADKVNEFASDLAEKLSSTGIQIDPAKVTSVKDAITIYANTKAYMGAKDQLTEALKDYLRTDPASPRPAE